MFGPLRQSVGVETKQAAISEVGSQGLFRVSEAGEIPPSRSLAWYRFVDFIGGLPATAFHAIGGIAWRKGG